MKKQRFLIPDPAKMTVEDNASLLQSSTIADESEHEICCVCKKKPSNHSVGDRRLCCKCYVKEGHAPADWHRGCMEAYKMVKDKSK